MVRTWSRVTSGKSIWPAGIICSAAAASAPAGALVLAPRAPAGGKTAAFVPARAPAGLFVAIKADSGLLVESPDAAGLLVPLAGGTGRTCGLRAGGAGNTGRVAAWARRVSPAVPAPSAADAGTRSTQPVTSRMNKVIFTVF